MRVDKRIFNIHGDNRGSLIALNGNIDVPFEIKRVYYMFGTKPNVRRGGHAHKNLKQVLISMNGSCKIHLNDGKETCEVVLDRPDVGLYLSNNIWREMYDFSDDCVLMVLASEVYDESDYIRNFDDFIKFINNSGE